jgi:mRNA interferase MazF
LFNATLANRGRIDTVVCVPVASNLKWDLAFGNLRLAARQTGLPRDSVANVSQIVALDKVLLTKRFGKIPLSQLELLIAGINLVLGK